MEKTRPQIDIRRNSTGSFGMKALIQPLPLPNYLRASMGSCHDYCKYGIKCKTSENVKTKEVKIIQQKSKQQKAEIPKPLNKLKMETLKKEVSSPKSQTRRYSDVCLQTLNFMNASKMAGGVPKTTTRSVKRDDSKNASPKGLPQSKNKASKPPKCDSKNAPPKGLPESKNKASKPPKCDSKNAPPKDLPQSINKAKTRIEEQSFQLPVEKILYVDELTPVKQHAYGFAQEAVESLFMPQETEDKSYINVKALSLSVPQETEDMSYIDVKALSLSVPEETKNMSYIDEITLVKQHACGFAQEAVESLSMPQETEDKSYINVKALSLSVPQETEDKSYIDVKALSLSVPQETEDMSYIDVKALSLSAPEETEDMSYIDVKALSLSALEETDDMSYNNVKAFSLSVPEETEDRSYNNVKAFSLSVPEETEDTSCINVKALSLSSDTFASATTISCEPDSDSSSRDIESTETRNENTKVVLRHQNTEQKRLPDAARKLEEAKKIKVKALVSAFEALISLEDNKSLGNDINMILSPVQY